jgi:hypothetical protein
MDSEIRNLCVRVLEAPTDRGLLRELIGAVGELHGHIGTQLSNYVENGQTERGFMESEDTRRPFLVHYVITRLLPKQKVVRFASRCARKLLGLFERTYPAEPSARALLDLVDDWANRLTTRKAVEKKLTQVQKVAVRLDREWHMAYARGDFKSSSREELAMCHSPLLVMEAVLVVAGAVKGSSSLVIHECVDEVVDLCTQAETAGRKNGANKRKVIVWQLRALKQEVMSNP